jgi:hypothetical protein
VTKRPVLVPPPPVASFSKEAIEKAVLKTALEEPITLYSSVLGTLGLMGGFVFTSPGVALTGGGVLLLGVAGKIINFFFRHDALEGNYLSNLRRKQQLYIAELPNRLKESLQEYDSEKGIRQIEELENSFDDFQEIIKGKFSTSGMTLERYLGIVEQLRIQALEKFEIIISLYKSVESIDVKTLERELKQSRNRETDAIKQRLGHYERAQEEIDRLHDDIEQSLTAISELSLQIAQVGNDEDSETKFETTLETLRSIVQGAAQMKKEL